MRYYGLKYLREETYTHKSTRSVAEVIFSISLSIIFNEKNPFDKCFYLVMLLIYFVVIREKTLSVTNDTVNGIVLGSIILEKEKSVRPH